MEPVFIDLRLVDSIDIRRLAIPLPPAPPGRSLSSVERSVLANSIDLLKNFSPRGGIYSYPLDFSEHPPTVHILPSSSVGVGRRPGSSSAATLALGISTAAFAGAGVGIGAGLYGSTTREIGVYASGTIGGWTNVGASAGGQYTFIFGPPSDFAGPCWAVGCGVSGEVVGGEALLLFTLIGRPFRCLGYSVSIGVGPSALPLSMTVQMSHTTTRPILYFP